ncbi:hypothetical protein [Agrobacterium pusense]|uniref:hypothetical protein n=1 Tax=Agrobacterium pusense TaxID=648995 RepID=UPI001C6F1492|nr:hypothetical protein [Agrobacterium pusense]MBW9070630.1 hypothetical protein [Agrobacterium pusense]MBW9085723.1 hypothetical protein [Agrobacterium pusense]MBW9127254.1 hypothetical protein [Agrobacterium pusense]MBW9138291.1 hypothetical protein [Agrobacterium pusense]
MTKRQLTGWVAAIIVFGHFFVFMIGLLVGVFGLMSGVDALQTVLMASPVLASTAIAAFSHILARKARAGLTIAEDDMVVLFCFAIPVMLILSLCGIFWLFYLQIDGFGPDQLKITLGALETVFGAFLGAISKRLFGVGVLKQGT